MKVNKFSDGKRCVGLVSAPDDAELRLAIKCAADQPTFDAALKVLRSWELMDLLHEYETQFEFTETRPGKEDTHAASINCNNVVGMSGGAKDSYSSEGATLYHLNSLRLLRAQEGSPPMQYWDIQPYLPKGAWVECTGEASCMHVLTQDETSPFTMAVMASPLGPTWTKLRERLYPAEVTYEELVDERDPDLKDGEA